MEFTDEEKAVLTLILNEEYSFKRAFLHYWPFLLPPIFMGIYGFIKRDYIALTMAFSILLMMSFWYIVRAEVYGKVLQSLLRKFDKVLSEKSTTG